MLCRHCDRNPANRCRGLCRDCFAIPEIRERYPPRNQRGAGSLRFNRPCRPTAAAPGSPEKIRVLIERASRGETLFHDDDGREDLVDLELSLAG